MRPRVKSALLWGAVGFMTYMVLAQGFTLVEGPALSIWQHAAIGVVVACGAVGAAYALEHRVAEWSARRARGGGTRGSEKR